MRLILGGGFIADVILRAHDFDPQRPRTAIKFFYATQASVEPPTFVFFVNYPQGIHFSYERYLQRRIREEFGFPGAPLLLRFRARKNRYG